MSLDAELVMMDGEVVGTKNPTGHSLLVDCRFELPFGKYYLYFNIKQFMFFFLNTITIYNN